MSGGPCRTLTLGAVTFLALLTACVGEQPGVRALRQSAEQGDRVAMYKLGMLYKEDQEKSFRWLAKATDPLEGFYPEGGEELWVPPDDDEALVWFSRAAELGHPAAMYQLAGMYAGGKGIDADLFLAHVWLSRAAERLKGEQKQRALARREEVGRRISAYQRDESRRLTRTWRPKSP